MMAPRASGTRALASFLYVVLCISACQGFCGVMCTSRPSLSASSSGRSSSPKTATSTTRRFRWIGPTGLRSTANDDSGSQAGNTGGGSGGDFEGKVGEGVDNSDSRNRSGIFGGLINWWETEGISDLKIYGTSLALALIVRTVAVEPRFIPSLSMYPTFEIGDQLAVDKLSVRFARPYQRKDVVVFHPPPKFSEFSNRGSDEALIKRVIAVDGDTVEIKDGSLFINGEEQLEDYTFEEPEYKWGPQTVPEGMVMVLGDNRNHSLDSHIWGFLPRENVIGRAIFKYWPPWRAGLVEV